MSKQEHGPILGWTGNPDEIPAETRWCLRITVKTEREQLIIVHELKRAIEKDGVGWKYRLESKDFGPFAVVVASCMIDMMPRAFYIGTMYVIPLGIELQRGDDFE